MDYILMFILVVVACFVSLVIVEIVLDKVFGIKCIRIEDTRGRDKQ
jgi:hypothetical protein